MEQGLAIDLGTLPSGNWSGAIDINNGGHVVGASTVRVVGGDGFIDVTRAASWTK